TPPFDVTGRWFAKGNGYFLEHEFNADGRCQWWMRTNDNNQLAHWSGRYEYRNGGYFFIGDASYPRTHSKRVFHWQAADHFTSNIQTSSNAQLIGATHVHYRMK